MLSFWVVLVITSLSDFTAFSSAVTSIALDLSDCFFSAHTYQRFVNNHKTLPILTNWILLHFVLYLTAEINSNKFLNSLTFFTFWLTFPPLEGFNFSKSLHNVETARFNDDNPCRHVTVSYHYFTPSITEIINLLYYI